jgi:hypothetical protein
MAERMKYIKLASSNRRRSARTQFLLMLDAAKERGHAESAIPKLNGVVGVSGPPIASGRLRTDGNDS